MASRYHWVITQDRTTGAAHEGDATGTYGPSGSELTAEQIRKHPQAIAFQMCDGDGSVYYEGLYVGPGDETLFAPLDDYGMPNAGCTDIAYRDAMGAWEWL